MRRSIAPTLLVCAVMAAAAALSIAVFAGSAGASPHIICPQHSHIVPGCCPLPPGTETARAQPVCCQTTPCCANPSTPCCTTTCCPSTTSAICCTPTTCGSAPTISSSPNPSRAGQKVVISGTAAPGAQVALWRELASQSSFQQVNTTTADSSGKYSFTLKRGSVLADQKWYVTANGSQSATAAQLVEAQVALSASSRSTVVGRKVVLRGHVTPSHAGELVLVEMSRGGAWKVIARPRLGHGSGYSVSRRFARTGAVKLRVVLRGDSRNDRSTSSTLSLKVNP